MSFHLALHEPQVLDVPRSHVQAGVVAPALVREVVAAGLDSRHQRLQGAGDAAEWQAAMATDGRLIVLNVSLSSKVPCQAGHAQRRACAKPAPGMPVLARSMPRASSLCLSPRLSPRTCLALPQPAYSLVCATVSFSPDAL